ncbi:MAG: hypothetical protein WHT06_16630 [Desulfobacterales bacterium]
MDDERRLNALERVYALYDGYLRGKRIACRRHCRPCCTTRVTVTTLEARAILRALAPGERTLLEDRVLGAAALPRRKPSITLNGLAELWAAGLEEPSPAEEPPPEACPLLADDLCSIYALRPFHCRCLVSRRVCAADGAAELEEEVLAVNTVFLQVIEHLDPGGASGNLLDVLAALLAAGGEASPAAGTAGLVPNRPLRRLLLPAEHRAAVEPLLAALRRIRI